MKKLLLFFSSILVMSNIYTIDDEEPPLTIFALPGLSGSNKHVYLTNLLENHKLDIVHVESPLHLPDLGQGRCLKYLHKAMLHKEPTQRTILHATSQGTATAINKLAHETNPPHVIRAVILESPFASGNSAIMHSLKHDPRLAAIKFIASIPCANYIVPYFANFEFPLYLPAGKQPIKSLATIPDDTVYIIAHAREDNVTSFEDSCALYYGLCQYTDPTNVYLIPYEGNQHGHLLIDDKELFEYILKKHELLSGYIEQEFDLSEYQPDPTQFKELHDNLLRIEKRHETFGKALICTGIIAAGTLLANMLF